MSDGVESADIKALAILVIAKDKYIEEFIKELKSFNLKSGDVERAIEGIYNQDLGTDTLDKLGVTTLDRDSIGDLSMTQELETTLMKTALVKFGFTSDQVVDIFKM